MNVSKMEEYVIPFFRFSVNMLFDFSVIFIDYKIRCNSKSPSNMI